MQKQRQAHGLLAKDVAAGYGCHRSHISRVEGGKARPSRELVMFYEDRFAAEGLLLSLWETADYHAEHERRRVGGHRPVLVKAVPGDASEYVNDTVPHGTVMKPGEVFEKTWWVRNTGTIPWVGRVLERQGPLTAPGLITSRRFYRMPDTEPGQVAEIIVHLRAPTYSATSIAYFKMAHGRNQPLCFPDQYQLGLDVLVRVVEQPPMLVHEPES